MERAELGYLPERQAHRAQSVNSSRVTTPTSATVQKHHSFTYHICSKTQLHLRVLRPPEVVLHRSGLYAPRNGSALTVAASGARRRSTMRRIASRVVSTPQSYTSNRNIRAARLRGCSLAAPEHAVKSARMMPPHSNRRGEAGSASASHTSGTGAAGAGRRLRGTWPPRPGAACCGFAIRAGR